MIRILVTAFGAFPGAPVNPTMAIARALARRRRMLALTGVDLQTRVLPVVFAGTEERIAQLLAETCPDVVVLMGLAGRRKAISVETRALNRLTILRPDARGRYARSLLALAGGPAIRRARYRAEPLARAISSAGARARLSQDAGDYLCNQALYGALGLHEGLCGFIHVPLPRARRRRRPIWPVATRPTLAAMARAIEAGVRTLAIAARQRSGAI